MKDKSLKRKLPGIVQSFFRGAARCKYQLSFSTFCVVVLFFFGCTSNEKNEAKPASEIANEKKQIIAMLDSFNAAAVKADYNTYFDFYTDDAIFTGTDAAERWNKNEFMIWAKPFFDRGKAWAFTAIDRNVYFSPDGVNTKSKN